MTTAHTATMERAANGWPFPKDADSNARAIIESYAPISPDLECELTAAKERLSATTKEKDAAVAFAQAANQKHAVSVRDYQSVVRRINEYRAALAKAGV